MPRLKSERIHGPFEHGKRWRVVVIAADGTRSYPRESEEGLGGFATQASAQDYIDEFREACDGRTIGTAVTQYLEHLRRYGNRNRPLRPSSVKTAEYRLLAFFQLPTSDKPLTGLTRQYAARLYSARVRAVRVDTHRGELAVASTFGRWCVEQGWVRVDPFGEVRPEGSLAAGKATLRVDDARLFLSRALGEGTSEGVACAALLLMGLRVSELTERVVADLDEGGTVLAVPISKTRAGVRRLVIPRLLRAAFARLAEGRERSERLFGKSRYSLHHHVGRICREAGVPEVCPHGLRGTATSSAVELQTGLDQGQPSTPSSNPAGLESIQRALGHEVGSGITERHYMRPGLMESAASAGKERLLSGSAGNSLGTGPSKSFPATPVRPD